jgi:hypothetical protein
VLAAAIRGGAQAIITANAKDFPAAALTPLGLEAVHPDDFLLGRAGIPGFADELLRRMASPLHGA